ncbi:MAG: cohesin domain-containing protein [Chitinispirillaceae bacterium]|nr:cohesin domain-containing protein [Chitinispirillaceae bacterium]
MFYKRNLLKGLIIVIISGVASFAANITVSPNQNIVENGSIFQVDIVLSEMGGEILSGFDICLKYDPSIFSFVNYNITDAMGSLSDGSVKDLSVVNNESGLINVAALSLLFDIPLQIEPLVISNINMKVIQGEKSSKLELIDPILINYYGEMIPIGNIYGALVETVPEPSLIYSFLSSIIVVFIGSVLLKRKIII